MEKRASPAADTDPPVTINRQAYEVAKAKAGLRYDMQVADAMGVHPVTWSRILAGKYPLVEAKQQALARVFPGDYEAITGRPPRWEVTSNDDEAV